MATNNPFAIFDKRDQSQGEAALTRRPAIFRIPKIHDDLISDQGNQYLIIKGGRGGFKTTSYLCAMVEESYRYSNCAFLCTREVAKSISDSVYAVVKDLIEGMGDGVCYACRPDGRPFRYSSGDFEIQKTQIINRKTGVRFIFSGLRATGGKTAMSQINKVKGLHKIRLVMMEEGQDLSEDSLNVLMPTVNRKGSAAMVRDLQGHVNYVKKVAQQEGLDDDLSSARFFVAMNPNKEFDPVVSKFTALMAGGKVTIAHINMMDIGGELGDQEPRQVVITVNGEPMTIETEPDLQDAGLLNQMELERGEYYWGHVWNGEPFHRFAGLPFSHWKWVAGIADNDIDVMAMWLDPSFKGGDFTALSAIGRVKSTGRVVIFGRAYKSAWNMLPALPGISAQYRKWGPDKFWFEDNSLGTVPITILGGEGIPAKGITSLMNKEDKIYKVAAFAGGVIDIAEDQCCPIWSKMVREYTDEAEHDDPPDSLASLVVQTGVIKEKLKF